MKKLLKDEIIDVRLAAIRALAKIGDSEFIKDLEGLSQDESMKARKEAQIAIAEIKSKSGK